MALSVPIFFIFMQLSRKFWPNKTLRCPLPPWLPISTGKSCIRPCTQFLKWNRFNTNQTTSLNVPLTMVYMFCFSFTESERESLNPIWKALIILFGVISIVALLLSIFMVHNAIGELPGPRWRKSMGFWFIIATHFYCLIFISTLNLSISPISQLLN